MSPGGRGEGPFDTAHSLNLILTTRRQLDLGIGEMKSGIIVILIVLAILLSSFVG